MDDVHSDWEAAAKKAAATLQIWCATISPLDSYKNASMRMLLAYIAHEMNWQTKYNADLEIQEIVINEEKDDTTTK
jgi:hypothetical protein